MKNAVLLFMRGSLAAIWLYQGFYLKLLGADPRHREIIASAGLPFGPDFWLWLLGGGETLLGLWVLSGLLPRCSATAQIVLLAVMNTVGILSAGHAIPDPIGMVLHNLPLAACALGVACFGPGPVWPRLGKHGENRTVR